MPSRLLSMFAQPFQLPSSVLINIADDDSTRSYSFTPSRVFRTFLADATTSAGHNGGSVASPDEWLRGGLQRALNIDDSIALYTVGLTNTGHVTIRYSGATGSVITMDGTAGTSAIPAYLSGFPAAPLVINAGQTVTAPGQPMYCVFCCTALANSGNWGVRPRRTAIAELDDGDAVAFAASQPVRQIRGDWQFHPYDAEAKASLGEEMTQYQPDDAARWNAPPAICVQTASASVTPPWSLVDWFATVPGVRVAAALGNFPELVAGTQSAFFVTTFARSTLQAEDSVEPSAPNLGSRVNWRNVALRYYAKGSR